MHLRREEGARTIATVTIDVRAWAFHCFIPSCSGQIIAKFYLYCNRSCRQNLCSSFWADVWVGASWSLSLLKKHRSCLVRPVTRLSAVCLILDKLRKREKKNRSTPEGFDHTRAYGHSGQSDCNSSSTEIFFLWSFFLFLFLVVSFHTLHPHSCISFTNKHTRESTHTHRHYFSLCSSVKFVPLTMVLEIHQMFPVTLCHPVFFASVAFSELMPLT